MLRRSLLIANLFLVVVAISSLAWPMGRDQGIFAWAGDAILHGGTPYRDIWEVKGPAAHYTFALAIRLFGNNQWGIRLLDLLLTAAGMIALWRVVTALADRYAANLAVVFYLLWYWGMGYWHAAQPDAWIGIFELIALSLLLGNETPRRLWHMALAGACLAVAMAYKPPFGLCFLALLPAAWTPEAPIKKRVGLLLAGVAGFCVPLLLLAIWFAHRGAIHDLLEIQFTFNVQVHRSSDHLSFAQHVHGVIDFLALKGVVFLTASSIIGIGYLWRKSPRGACITLLMLGVDVACVGLQQKYYPYHWIPALAPLAMLLGLASFRARQGLIEIQAAPGGAEMFRRGGAIVLLAAFFWSGMELAKPLGLWMASAAHLRSWDAYNRALGGQWYLDQREVAQYLAQRTSPSQTVLQWNFDPMINYRAARLSPTRFGFNYPLVRGGTLQQEWRREFMHDLEAHPPAYIVVAQTDVNNLMLKSSAGYMQEFPEFDAYVHRHFQVETRIGDYEIWRRSGSEGPGRTERE